MRRQAELRGFPLVFGIVSVTVFPDRVVRTLLQGKGGVTIINGTGTLFIGRQQPMISYQNAIQLFPMDCDSSNCRFPFEEMKYPLFCHF